MLALALALAGCRISPPPAPVVGGPDWSLQRGQAIWQPSLEASPIAGELLVATHRDGEWMVQFSKTPFPTIIARSDGRQWTVQYYPQNRTVSGAGAPPADVLWLQLPAALATGRAELPLRPQARPLPAPWQFETGASNGRWRLTNRVTGESLEGYLDP